MTEQHRLFFVVLVLSCGLAYALTADEYISLGDEDFIARKLDKALSNYDKAISADSSSERAYYKRATIYIQTKKYRQALYDLNQVLIINPNYHLALISRAQVHQEQGDFEKAKEDLSSVLKINPKSSTKVDQQLGVIADIETTLTEGTKHFANKDYTSAREKFGTIIDKAPGLSKVRLLRSEAAYKLRLWNEVIEDTGKILKQDAKNLKAILIRGNAFRQLGQLDAAVNHYKNCLGWAEDADCKRSLALLEQFRSDLASANDNDEEGRALLTLRDVEKCIQYIEAEDVDYFKVEVYTLRCSAYVEYKEADKALEACNVVLSIDEKNGDALQLKGEAYILKEDFEEGVRMYQKAVEAGDNSAQEGLGNAKRLLKISKRKDYYKILGVEKTANAKDVKKAYRLLALKWHPDKNPDNPEAQKIFLDLMEANEVLSSDDMRRRYDNGEDIEDLQKPQSPFQSNNPFQGGFTFHWG